MIEPHHIKAAIIGFYRQGAKIDEIASVTGVLSIVITNIIHEYFKPNSW